MEQNELLAQKRAIIKAKTELESAKGAELGIKWQSEIKSSLETLKKWRATADLLRSTQIGTLVNGLRKSNLLDAEVVKLAQSVVLQWKRDVSEATTPATEQSTQPRKRPLEKGQTIQNKKAKPSVETRLESATSPGPTSADHYASERTADGDNADCNVTDDRIRNNCVKMLYKGLASFTTEPTKVVLEKATTIEEAVFEAHSQSIGDKYKTRIRSMYLNLMDKSNSTLRFRVLSSEISVNKFATMTKEEMASEDVREKAARVNKDNLAKAIVAVNNEAETDMFKCGKCGQRKTRYYQMQTRSADEPMTTFVTCLNCGNRWKFC